MIDDGLQTSTELRALKEFWKIDSEKDPTGRLWDSKMLGLFTTGVSVKVNRYPKDNGREARMVYQAGRHNVDNNKLRFTSVATIVQVGTTALAKSGGKKRASRTVSVGAIWAGFPFCVADVGHRRWLFFLIRPS